jgi:hypothetical protein
VALASLQIIVAFHLTASLWAVLPAVVLIDFGVRQGEPIIRCPAVCRHAATNPATHRPLVARSRSGRKVGKFYRWSPRRALGTETEGSAGQQQPHKAVVCVTAVLRWTAPGSASVGLGSAVGAGRTTGRQHAGLPPCRQPTGSAQDGSNWKGSVLVGPQMGSARAPRKTAAARA